MFRYVGCRISLLLLFCSFPFAPAGLIRIYYVKKLMKAVYRVPSKVETRNRAQNEAAPLKKVIEPAGPIMNLCVCFVEMFRIRGCAQFFRRIPEIRRRGLDVVIVLLQEACF